MTFVERQPAREFSRKHHERIAGVIDAQREMQSGSGQGALHALASDLARVFNADNEQFDYDRFMEACGFPRKK